MARSLGIEIEFAGSRSDLFRRLRQEGIPVQNSEEYGDFDSDSWDVKTDGSVYNGGEITSPVGDHDDPRFIEQVSTVVKLMREVGCTPSEQAGIHVHVGTHDMTAEQAAAVAYGFVRHEDFLYRMASSGWDHMRSNSQTYAHPYSRHDKALLIAEGFRPETVAELASADRYYGVNFQRCMSGYRRGRGFTNDARSTIEFRLFNTTMNPERVQAFLHTAAGLVKAAINGRLGSPTLSRYNCYPLGGMAEGWRSERAVINAAMRAFSGGNRVLTPAQRRVIMKYWRSAVPQDYSNFGAQYRLPGWTGPETLRRPLEAALVPRGDTDDQELARNAPGDDPDDPYYNGDERCHDCDCYECCCDSNYDSGW